MTARCWDADGRDCARQPADRQPADRQPADRQPTRRRDARRRSAVRRVVDWRDAERRATVRRRSDLRDEGSISLFTLGWVVVALLAVAVLVGATQVHLARVRLVALADELAVAAATQATNDGYAALLDEGAGGGDPGERAADAIADRMSRADARQWLGEVSVVSVRVDDHAVEVVLSRPVVPLVPDAGWLPGGSVTVVADGSARVG